VGERIGAHIMTMYLLALLPVLGFLPAPINRADTSPLPKAPRINAHAPVSMLTLADEVDEAAMLAASTFPIKPDALIDRCKTVILEQMKIQDGSIDENIYADNFRFCAPFVGGPTPAQPGDPMPGLSKSEYLNALRNFDLLQAFPDMNNNYHGFYVDPFEPNRVWFRTRVFATHTGPLLGGEPTGKKLELPPQSFSMTFNDNGQLTFFNVGYVIDRTVGNTGGLGGAFGFFWSTGNALPFPECQPFKGSVQLRGLGLLQQMLKLLPGQS